ncbi:MAG TPA: aminotransferase class I/II-fold pyridoxal phosphate-dependent enzyme [Bryobacteraceae bacterium]|nr:aminotransferase class I/II-fold pyridoxal phosphate-dependent enzyme [Bryobacteraceae bacterium]
MTVHGGDVWQVEAETGIPAGELLDFSANINPRGLPTGARDKLTRDASDARLLGLYPDPSARQLRQALSEHLRIPPESIAVGPGAESLLGPALRCLRARRALVPVPAFSEYRRVCEQQEVEYVPFALDRSAMFRVPIPGLSERMAAKDCDLAVLNNPHNPSGSMLDAREIRAALDAIQSRGASLLVDEAFIDYAPAETLAAEAAVRPGLVVIRSLTKFYGCPALRVGYAIAHPASIRGIVSCLPTWPVTQLAMDALAEAIADRKFAEESLRENAIERERLGAALTALGLSVFPSAANFLLLELTASMPIAAALRARLIERYRILIRNCDSYEGLAPGRYVRVAVRSAGENGRLIHALAGILRQSY